MPDAHRLGSACVMLALLASVATALAQDGASKAAPEPQPPANTSPADPPAPGAAHSPAVVPAVPDLDAAALEALVSKLDDSSLAERERAMDALRKLPGVSVRAIERCLRRDSLSPEQRVRLGQVGQSLFLDEPRAAMGVSFTQGLMDDEDVQVQVESPTPGWDAARVLRPMDVLRTIDGLRLRSRAEARAAIISHDPGETVSLEIIRNGQPGTVRVRLGDFADLGNRGFIDAVTYEAAWRLRLARANAESSKPLIIDVVHEDWSNEPVSDGLARMERMNHPITSEPLRTQMRQIPVSDVSAAGPSRATGEREVNNSGQASLTFSSGPSLRGLGGNVRNLGIPRDMARAMIESNKRVRDGLIQSIAHWRQMAADPNISAEQAAKIRDQVERFGQRLARLEEQINAQEQLGNDR